MAPGCRPLGSRVRARVTWREMPRSFVCPAEVAARPSRWSSSTSPPSRPTPRASRTCRASTSPRPQSRAWPPRGRHRSATSDRARDRGRHAVANVSVLARSGYWAAPLLGTSDRVQDANLPRTRIHSSEREPDRPGRRVGPRPSRRRGVLNVVEVVAVLR
jgi:hypothetical protein